jgi:hypothetical protein
MDEKYKRSFSEVYEILKLMPDGIVSKVPKKLKDIIETERDKNYNVIIKEPLNTEDFQYETIVFLGMIYRDFLCNDDERNNLKEKDAELIKKYEEELRKKYNTDDLFNNRKKVKKENTDSLPIKVEEKKWFQKLFDFVKGIFR